MQKCINVHFMGERAEHAESMNPWIMAARGMQGPQRHCQKVAHASLGLWQVELSTDTHLWAGDIVSLCKLPRTET